jgi:hypothetical protein
MEPPITSKKRKKNAREQTWSKEEDMECIVYSGGGRRWMTEMKDKENQYSWSVAVFEYVNIYF